MQASSLPAAALNPAIQRPILRQTTQELAERGLNFASKWLAELLVSLAPEDDVPVDEPGLRFSTSTPLRGASGAGERGGRADRGGRTTAGRESLPGLGLGASIARKSGYRDSLGSVGEMEGSSPVGRGERMEEDIEEESAPGDREIKERGRRLDVRERDLYSLGLAFFRTHELLRAAHILEGCKGPKARWLWGYSKFLAGEKSALEASGDLLSSKDKGVPNPFAQEILNEMSTWEEGCIDNDGYLLFLKAILLLALPPLAPAPIPPAHGVTHNAHGDLRLSAIDTLVESVRLEPLNWSAWLKIAACLDGPEEFEAISRYIPPVFVSLFFSVHATLEIHAAGEGLHETLDVLEETLFPNSPTIRGLRGLIYYHVREFDEATSHFSSLREEYPYRLEDIDTYSNILYVSEKRAELAMLAQEYTKLDRWRPEVCCLVGNYYSLRREHEKAIIYFRRALKLDPGYLSAWTLMGHEYVEIKNTNAAIASYRRAVDVNRKDYRAWYGLGQTYELLGEPFYALNYYQKATALRPYDARMWAALAVCFEKLKRIPEAIKSYSRSLVSSEPGDIDTLTHIARLHSLLGATSSASAYYRRALSEGLKAGLGKGELSRVWLWIAREEMRREREEEGEGDLVLARSYLNEVMGVQEDKEEAKTLLKEVQTLLLDRD